jgi:hypothetical protein
MESSSGGVRRVTLRLSFDHLVGLREQRRQDSDGMSPEIAPPGCRSSVRRSTDPNCPQGQENVSHGSPAAMAAPIVG